jgi:hypothetical protein
MSALWTFTVSLVVFDMILVWKCHRREILHTTAAAVRFKGGWGRMKAKMQYNVGGYAWTMDALGR